MPMMKDLSKRVEAAILSPLKTGIALAVLAATGLLLSRLFIPWSGAEYAFLVGDAALTYSIAVVRGFWGYRFPDWTFNIDVGIYIVIVSALTIVGSRHGLDTSRLFSWIAIFTALYMPRRAVMVHVGLIGVALAIVIHYSSGVAEPVATWVIAFGTVAVVAGIISALVLILRRISTQDAITQLANRRTWDERLDEEVERARRSGAALSVVVIDIDNFKSVNDRDGHPAGDAILRAFADGWRDVVRDSGDFLARLGGDEFGVLAPAADEMGGRRLTTRLAGVSPGGVTCSIGVATWDRTESAGSLFRRADEAMFVRKRSVPSSRTARAAGPDEALH